MHDGLFLKNAKTTVIIFENNLFQNICLIFFFKKKATFFHLTRQ